MKNAGTFMIKRNTEMYGSHAVLENCSLTKRHIVNAVMDGGCVTGLGNFTPDSLFPFVTGSDHFSRSWFDLGVFQQPYLSTFVQVFWPSFIIP